VKKDFWKWHQRKSNIDKKGKRVFFHEREVWWCSVGTNVGFEINGKGPHFARPVIIFRKFNNEAFWAIPLTTKDKVNKFYTPVDLRDSIQRKAVLSQLRLLDSKRLLDKIGTVTKHDFSNIQKAILNLMGIKSLFISF
jgi:mRNA interferase MazF